MAQNTFVPCSPIQVGLAALCLKKKKKSLSANIISKSSSSYQYLNKHTHTPKHTKKTSRKGLEIFKNLRAVCKAHTMTQINKVIQLKCVKILIKCITVTCECLCNPMSLKKKKIGNCRQLLLNEVLSC